MSQPTYDLEYMAIEDGAWYSVSVELADDGETLTLLPECMGSSWRPIFRARDFQSADEVDDFFSRFRPLSLPLQDKDRRKMTEGMTVCASLSSPQKTDLRFYDAVVEGVEHVDHGEEECLCSFLLCWEHGRNAGYITSAGVADICLIQPSAVVHSQLEAFRCLAMEKVLAANSMPLVCAGKRTLSQRISQDVDLGSNLFDCEIVQE